ncbi:dTDP-4-dehydrorhamnose reductase [Hydromonas duriensis]|uniref:dTDP-4-dehydrorhamnose reductase n=1 Tax=Hydromonas duriensis TaxID=1527608 RepID=A0A4R6Y863_9BURK|nr:dTDP-4-dehydrorhamnose reductase [Hydromonas duriensis]TDR31567.1 dTDP-4-dehydrorhamnose reductase [Hydromonas duriensis]
MMTHIPKILITGVNGQVGFELQRALAPLGSLLPISRSQLDLTDGASIVALLDDLKPDIIVNPAAYTAVDKAEADQETARAVNAVAPDLMAQWVEANGALLVHYSTDYVFDGNQAHAYIEEDDVHPQSVYGLTKQQGEVAIIKATKRHVILRTSWVFGAYGNNFLKTMLRLAAERDALSIVNDQIGSPTSASLIADVTAHIVRDYIAFGEEFIDECTGLFHLTASGESSWHEYAQYVVGLAEHLGVELKVKAKDIKGIPSSAYPTPAKRPMNSRLNTDKIKAVFDLHLPSWQEGVFHAIHMIRNNK